MLVIGASLGVQSQAGSRLSSSGGSSCLFSTSTSCGHTAPVPGQVRSLKPPAPVTGDKKLWISS